MWGVFRPPLHSDRARDRIHRLFLSFSAVHARYGAQNSGPDGAHPDLHREHYAWLKLDAATKNFVAATTSHLLWAVG